MEEPHRYRITGQDQIKGYDQARNLVDMYEIYYTAPGGINGSIRVPVAQASAAYVDELITSALTTQLQIAQLGS